MKFYSVKMGMHSRLLPTAAAIVVVVVDASLTSEDE
jgi:hypothetical protein